MGSSPAKRAPFPAGERPGASGVPKRLHGRLAQLVRASVLHTEGQRFESRQARSPSLPVSAPVPLASRSGYMGG